MTTLMRTCAWFGAGLAFALAPTAMGQAHIPSKVEIAWNRYYDYPEIEAHMKAIAEAYPDLVELRNIGTSREGRDLWVAIVNPKAGPPHEAKPAMWIDGNVHGNEIQAAEATLYTLWYLTKAYGAVPNLTKIMDSYAFYLMPSVNPDGRQAWFDEAHTSSSSRQSRRPVDNDRDGLFDEDGPDDLDGDGSITQMWKRDPEGQWIRDTVDPRVFRRVTPPQKGEWTLLGQEGIDNDGDGRINEDGPGGDDMNRNWPSGWLPEYAQGGAGPYPFESPETRAVGLFILAHPNIAAGQSYHNSGGMILRGPGAQFREAFYPADDVRVYDEIANNGAIMLPYYRSMVIWRDLYTVHGGFVNWLAEGLGIISFTNELWTPAKYFQRDITSPNEAQQRLWRDYLVFGQDFKDYTEYDHPQYGKILIGGPNKWSSRNTPLFLLEEECHRNFAFTMYHADQMPVLQFGIIDVQDSGGGLWTITAAIENTKLIPTRTGVARRNGIGTHDILYCEPGEGVSLVAAGTVSSRFDKQMRFVRHEPGRMQVTGGIGSRGRELFRWIVRGPDGATIRLRYQAEKALDIETVVDLRETEPRP